MCNTSIRWMVVAFLLCAVGVGSAQIPEGWSSLDIGTTGGGASEAGGTWTVTGDGADIWGTSDAFHFVHRTLVEDGEITARVVSNGSGSDDWAKGGVMIRETLSPGSKHAMMMVTAGQGNGLAFQNRPTTGGASYSAHGVLSASPPHWVRLRRQGDTITAYSSTNGIDWVQMPDGIEVDSSANPVDIPMSREVYVGLFVTSHAAGELRTYIFDNVSVEMPMVAIEPVPEDGAVLSETWSELSWTPGRMAQTHDVYFGRSFSNVTEGTSGTFIGNQQQAVFSVGLPGTPYPEGLERGVTYYWRVDEVEADGVTKHRGEVWRFSVASEKAWNPVPPDGALFIPTYTQLSWDAGLGAEVHTVHLGEDYDAVANSETGKMLATTEYICRSLKPDTTYYWRVDEFDGQTTRKGEVWSFTTRSSELASTTFYYVDVNHPDARDSNPGTETEPWKSIQRGVRVLTPGDILLIKAGVYREAVILDKSGTESQPISIWAYPGDEGQVVINAAQPVTNWRSCAGPDDCAGNPFWEQIYVADVSDAVNSHSDNDFTILQVFQHGQRLDRSRYPDVGWHYPTTVPNPSYAFIDSTLTQPTGYFTGAICHIKTALWQMDMIPIAGFYNGRVTVAKSPRYSMSTDYGYYITIVVGEINEEGEWAYDPGQKKLYLWPQGGVQDEVEYTYRDYCMRTYDHVAWNHIRGLTLRYARAQGLWLYQAGNMTVEENTVEYAFNQGIYLQATNGHCDDNLIIHNTVRFSSSAGIATDSTAVGNRIAHNYVYATGCEHYNQDLLNGQSFGMFIAGPATEVYNNRIDRTGYTAIYMHGDIYGRDISYNYVTNVCLSLTDGSGIYAGGWHDGPEKDYFHHNIFKDMIGCQTMFKGTDVGLPVTIEKYDGAAPGIYVDERGNDRIIEDNTVIHSHMAGVFFHWAPGNVVRRNTLYGNEVCQIYLAGRTGTHERLVDEVIEDNILFATDGTQKTLYMYLTYYDDAHFGQSDRNYFYNPYNSMHIRVLSYLTGGVGWIDKYYSLNSWRNLTGYDANSRDFYYLNYIPSITVKYPVTSRIVYNPSLEPLTIDLEQENYCDVDGNKVFGSVTLEPFESKILVSIY